MSKQKYELRYLPLFYADVADKVDYIAFKLNNPKAANDLLDSIESAILTRLPFAEAFEPYHSLKERDNKYYRIYVGNFTIYYVVLHEDNKKIMEVRRFLYNGQNRDEVLT